MPQNRLKSTCFKFSGRISFAYSYADMFRCIANGIDQSGILAGRKDRLLSDILPIVEDIQGLSANGQKIVVEIFERKLNLLKDSGDLEKRTAAQYQLFLKQNPKAEKKFNK